MYVTFFRLHVKIDYYCVLCMSTEYRRSGEQAKNTDNDLFTRPSVRLVVLKPSIPAQCKLLVSDSPTETCFENTVSSSFACLLRACPVFSSSRPCWKSDHQSGILPNLNETDGEFVKLGNSMKKGGTNRPAFVKTRSEIVPGFVCFFAVVCLRSYEYTWNYITVALWMGITRYCRYIAQCLPFSTIFLQKNKPDDQCIISSSFGNLF